MAKCKIIEKSRFLREEAMDNVKGGITCDTNNPYSTGCTGIGIGYITCTAPSNAGGYQSSMCHGIGDLHTCGREMNFDISLCWGWKIFSSHCNAGRVYSI